MIRALQFMQWQSDLSTKQIKGFIAEENLKIFCKKNKKKLQHSL